MKELIKAEEQVKEYLWELEQAFVKAFVKDFPQPRPAYNTVSMIVRLLEKKGMVDYHAYSKTHLYYPLVSPVGYRKGKFRDVLIKHFNNSYKKLASFFVRKDACFSDTHIRSDIIEVLVILFWFNPFVYWYRKSIREVHEYMALSCC